MKSKLLIILTSVVLFLIPGLNFGQLPAKLGSTSTFALFTAGGAFDSDGATHVKGNIGSFTVIPTIASPGIIDGITYGPSDIESFNAAADVLIAYNYLFGLSPDHPTISTALAGQILTPGIYSTGTGAAATLEGTLTLNGQGNPDAQFIIQIDGSFSVGSILPSNVILINSASPNNVYFQVTGAFSLGAGSVSHFRGTLVSGGQIDLLEGSSLIGRALTKAGAIHLHNNVVTLGAPPAAPTANVAQPTCASATGTITVTAPLAVGMTYSIDGLTYQASVTFAGLIPGPYNVYAMDADGYVSPATSKTINAVPLQPVATASSNTPVCEGTLLSLEGGPNGMTTYAWTGPNLYTSNSQSPVVSANATLLMAGNYILTVTDGSGCISLPVTTTVIVNSSPVATAANNGPVCQGTSLSLTGGPNGMTTYAWTGPNLYTSNSQSPVVSANATLLMAGNYILTVTDGSGCISLPVTTTVIVNSSPVATAANNGPVCEGTSLSLTGGPNGMTTYAWTGPNLYTSNSQSPVVSANATALMAGNYILTVTEGSGCISLPVTTSVIVNNCSEADLSILNTVDNTNPLIGRTVVFTVVVTNGGPGDATGVTVTDLLESGYTYVSSTATTGTYVPATGTWTVGNMANGVTETITITATVNPAGSYSSTGTITGNEPDLDLSNNTSTTITYPADFFIPEGFSPNGDGINDLFNIRGIFYFPGNSIVIFNRWGNKVYEADPYINTWDGRSIRGLRVGGDELPTGTYFYVLDLGDGSSIIKGTIYLNR